MSARGRGVLGSVIRPRDLRPGWIALYAGTFAINLLVCASVRGTVTYVILWLTFTIFNIPMLSLHYLVLAAAYGPLVLSLATLILPLGSWWWQQQEGGRSPSERERLIFEEALASLLDRAPGVRAPRRWFVVDEEDLEASVFADTLQISRGLLESESLSAVLAHELGHLASSDGRVTAALHRLTVPPRELPGWLRGWGAITGLFRAVAFFATGEISMWLLRAPWGIYWRSREHAADQYAASLGQAEPLAEFLDVHALPWDIPVPFVWLTEESHPPSEHRIDRLYQHEPNPS